MSDSPLINVDNVSVLYPVKSSITRRIIAYVQAVRDVSLSVLPGETLAVVGESGCGKSTLARAIAGIETPSAGTIVYEGTPYEAIPRFELASKVQMIFQDPATSLNPRRKVGQLVAEPWDIHPNARPPEGPEAGVSRLLRSVGLAPGVADAYPHQFSGGQQQRIAIARALALRPGVLVCDEPVSALDVSTQAQVLMLLIELQREFGLALVFVSHDLSVVNEIAHRLLVMYLGRAMEAGSTHEILSRPAHPYTQALVSAVPIVDPAARASRRKTVLHGELPSPVSPPSGCVFRTRCPKAEELCTKQPERSRPDVGRDVWCHFAKTDPAVVPGGSPGDLGNAS